MDYMGSFSECTAAGSDPEQHASQSPWSQSPPVENRGLNACATASPESQLGPSVDASRFMNNYAETGSTNSEDNNSLLGSDDPLFLDVAGSELIGTSSNTLTNSEQGNAVGQLSSSSSQVGLIEQHKPALRHSWQQTANLTKSKDLRDYVLEIANEGVRSYFCNWHGCRYPVGFAQKTQLITHIRSIHLHEKPFRCTACNATFARKQDASRHVAAMNLGKQYRCSFCHRAFSRKHYRDLHEERCVVESPSYQDATYAQAATASAPGSLQLSPP